MKPSYKPNSPYFCSGPTSKRPGWHTDILQSALLSRSHRSSEGIEHIQEMLNRTRRILAIPDDYHLALVGGSATGAVEMSLWNFLGTRPVDCLAWDIFGYRWQQQILHSLKLNNVRCLNVPEGILPDLNQVDCDHDVVFTWNGSTSGVCVPHGDWIADDRQGLTLCDATSAVFTMTLPWSKLDVTSFSWQKGLGSEAAHGMLVLSPRAVEHLNTHKPAWPIPGLYSLRNDKGFNKRLFEGFTINTPSMMCIADYLDALSWAESLGGLQALVQRSQANFNSVEHWISIQSAPWLQFLAHEPATRSSSTICLQLTDQSLTQDQQWSIIKNLAKVLSEQQVAYDIVNHIIATPAFRIWGGPTVESQDIRLLLEWLSWAYQNIYGNN